MTDADRVAATLAAIRADAQSLAQTNSPSWGTVPKIRRVIAGTERLLKAVEDALGLADEWKQIPFAVRASDECADELRAAITAALTGTQPSEDENHG